MSQIKFDRPLQVELKVSNIHKTFLYGIYFLSITALLLPSSLPVYIKLAGIVFIGLLLYKTAVRTKQNYTGNLHYLDEDNWLWIKQNKEIKARLVNGIILQPHLLVLTFSEATGKKYYWTLFPDTNSKETFRRVRILLRYSTADTHSSPV